MMIDKSILLELKRIFGDRIIVDKDSLYVYASDAMCEFRTLPAAVVFPKTTEEVAKLMKIAYEHEIPIYPRGGGTSLSGASMVLDSRGIVVSFTKMNRLLNVYLKDLQALAETGITIDELNLRLSQYGVFFPPDPASSPAATLGGCIAMNSGGVRAIKYGVVRNWILGLELVLPNGKVVRTGMGVFKRVAGYDLTQLIIGSEGTLALITKALIKLAPIPKYKVAMYGFFESERIAAETIYDLIISGIDLTAAEFLDRVTLRALGGFMGFKYTGNAMVLIEISGNDVDFLKRELKRAKRIFKEHKALEIKESKSEEEYLAIWKIRKGAAPALASLKPKYLVLDPTVPISKVPDLVEMINRVCEKYGIICGTFGHMGDGNVHPNLLYDPRDRDEVERMKKAAHEIMIETIRMGGTISGEHGIGIEKAELFKKEAGELYEVLQQLKKLFDPKNILNPGKIFVK